MTTVCGEYANRHDMKCRGYKLIRPYTAEESLVGVGMGQGEGLSIEGEEELAEWGTDGINEEKGIVCLEEEEQDVGVVKTEEEQDEEEISGESQRSK